MELFCLWSFDGTYFVCRFDPLIIVCVNHRGNSGRAMPTPSTCRSSLTSFKAGNIRRHAWENIEGSHCISNVLKYILSLEITDIWLKFPYCSVSHLKKGRGCHQVGVTISCVSSLRIHFINKHVKLTINAPTNPLGVRARLMGGNLKSIKTKIERRR